MGLFDKLKNVFFEEEYVEVEEPVKKEKVTVAKKIENPEIKEIKKIKEEIKPKVEKEPVVEETEVDTYIGDGCLLPFKGDIGDGCDCNSAVYSIAKDIVGRTVSGLPFIVADSVVPELSPGCPYLEVVNPVRTFQERLLAYPPACRE